jgi:hypothetical protein
VIANEIVGWVWREKLQHSLDFHVVFVAPGMVVGEEITVLGILPPDPLHDQTLHAHVHIRVP